MMIVTLKITYRIQKVKYRKPKYCHIDNIYFYLNDLVVITLFPLYAHQKKRDLNNMPKKCS